MRTVIVTVTGFALVLAGVAMLVLPGPGWVTIVGGLSVLRRQYAWAGRLLDWGRDHVVAMWNALRSR